MTENDMAYIAGLFDGKDLFLIINGKKKEKVKRKPITTGSSVVRCQ